MLTNELRQDDSKCLVLSPSPLFWCRIQLDVYCASTGHYGLWLMLNGPAIRENLCYQWCPSVFPKHIKALPKPVHQVTKLLASVLCNAEEIEHIKKKIFWSNFLKTTPFLCLTSLIINYGNLKSSIRVLIHETEIGFECSNWYALTIQAGN